MTFEDHERTTAAIASIGDNSPHLKDITIYPRGHEGYFVVTLPVVNSFECMSPTHLDLGMVIFNPQEVGRDWDYEGDEITQNSSDLAQWTALLSAVSGLQELRLERQRLWWVHFELFASLLPNLRLLATDSVTFGESRMEVNASQSILIRSWPCFGSCASVLEIAIYIYELWPNATWEPSAAELESNRGQADCTSAELNDALRALRPNAK
ncbi:hypothetical protein FRC12_018711 [Ceratobasidium sp. 428]|nr:hypothetical protein FRC12_018711 [Ceratobasidium sp. 428]